MLRQTVPEKTIVIGVVADQESYIIVKALFKGCRIGGSQGVLSQFAKNPPKRT